MNRSESSRIIKKVDSYLNEHFSGVENISAILGVSGGPDSMSLLYIFSKISIDLTVVHCNYQLRGNDSDQDQKLVEDTASMWGFDAISTRLDPSEAKGQNFQNWARKKRYQIFRDLKRETGANFIVTAHHQDDQLETIIQKILRGAGLTAWQGMKVWDGELFRPLLDLSKADILKFASENHIPYRHDSSNEESTYARNFLRNGWFPVLDDLFPGWRQNILKVPARAREHEELSKSLIRSLMPEPSSIDRVRFLPLAPDVQRTLLLQILKNIDPNITVSSGSLKNLENLESLQTGKKLNVNDRWSILRDRNLYLILDESLSDEKFEPVKIDRDDLKKGEVLIDNFVFSESEWDGEIDTSALQVDADSLKWPLIIRNWEEGDEINPFGMDGTQKISDLLTNNKIAASDKSSVLICETFDETISAVIFPLDSASDNPGTIAQWARCTPGTIRTLEVRKSG
jgi:tRNA(Ile)-lysidine synthase